MLNKPRQTPGTISKHITEMLKLGEKTQKNPENDFEAVQKPPKPASPLRMFAEMETKIPIQKSKHVTTFLQLLKTLKTQNIANDDLDLASKKLQNFINGGSRKDWLYALKVFAKQACLPLIKEIVYKRDK